MTTSFKICLSTALAVCKPQPRLLAQQLSEGGLTTSGSFCVQCPIPGMRSVSDSVLEP